MPERRGGGEASLFPLRDEFGGQVPASAGVEVQDLQVGSPARGLPPLVEVVAGGLELGVEVLEARGRPERGRGHLHKHDPGRVHVEEVGAVELPEDRGEDGGDGLGGRRGGLLGEHVELGRAVVRVEQGAVGHVVLADAEVGGGAEVDELDLAPAGDDEVGGLDVAVDDAGVVDAAERGDELPHHLLHHKRGAGERVHAPQRAPEHERLQVRREAAVRHVVAQRPVALHAGTSSNVRARAFGVYRPLPA